MRGVLLTIALAINYFSLFYVLVISSIYFIQLVSAAAGLRKYTRSLRYTDYERFVDSSNMVPISVLVPAYNEALRIPPTLIDMIDFCDSRGQGYEIIVVDDGSSDTTPAVVQKIERIRPQVRLIRLPRNYGKGHAVRTGMLSARGAADFITRATKWLAVTFVALSIVLAALAVAETDTGSLETTLDRNAAPAAPADPLGGPAPAAAPATAPAPADPLGAPAN